MLHGLKHGLVTVPLDVIHDAPWNPNRQTDKVSGALRQSIQAFGFVEPVIVREHPDVEGEYQLIGGAHRAATARDLGYTEIPAIVIEADDATAKKLTIILNETRGDADVTLLGELLNEMTTLFDADLLSVGLPYTDTELTHLVNLGATDWDQYRKDGYDDGVKLEPMPMLVSFSLELTPDQWDDLRVDLDTVREALNLRNDDRAVLECVKRVARELTEDA